MRVRKAPLKNRRPASGSPPEPTAVLPPEPIAVKKYEPEIELLLDDEDDVPVEERDFSHLVAKLFKADDFTKLWEDKAAEIFPEMQSIMATIYAYSDVATMLEEALIANSIDRNVEILDEKTKNEIAALAAFRLLMLFVSKTFNADDYIEVRKFMLQPEEASRMRKSGDNPSDLIKEMYKQMKLNAPRSPSPKDDDDTTPKPGATFRAPRKL